MGPLKNRQISKDQSMNQFHVIFPNQLFVYKINLLVALAMTPGAKLERTWLAYFVGNAGCLVHVGYQTWVRPWVTGVNFVTLWVNVG